MIYVNVLLTVKAASDTSTVRSLLAQLASLSKVEPGCARFEVYHSKDDDRLFLLVERWDTQEDLDRHRKASAFTELYQPKVLPLVDRAPHNSELVG